MSKLSPEFAFSYALTVAAAHDYLQRPQGNEDFTSFYMEHNLGDFNVLQQLYRTSVIKAMSTDQETSSKDIPGRDEVNNILDIVLAPAAEEVDLAYRYGRNFLLRSGVTDPGIVPVVQNSIPLGRLLGATRSAGITQKFNDHLASGEFDPEILTLTDDAGGSGRLDINDAGKKLLKASSDAICPMLGETMTLPGVPEAVKLYDLYWGALVLQAHINLEMNGELEMASPAESP